MANPKKTTPELEEIALKRVRARPGCRGVAGLAFSLDDAGEWALEVHDAGSADLETAHRAAIQVSHQMHDEFDLATDT